MKKVDLENEIKQIIIDSLELEDMSIDDIETSAPLFGDGLGLDSIDALEIGIALKKKYAFELESNQSKNREYFYSVETLAKYVATNKNLVLE